MSSDRNKSEPGDISEGKDKKCPGCLFCEIPANRIIDSNRHAYAIRDMYPVTELHTLIILRRHAASYFELEKSEIHAVTELLRKTRASIMTKDSTVEAFNIGINDGEASGQTIAHCHIHLIPRRRGDVKEPRGGVRHTIPGRGNY